MLVSFHFPTVAASKKKARCLNLWRFNNDMHISLANAKYAVTNWDAAWTPQPWFLAPGSILSSDWSEFLKPVTNPFGFAINRRINSWRRRSAAWVRVLLALHCSKSIVSPVFKAVATEVNLILPSPKAISTLWAHRWSKRFCKRIRSHPIAVGSATGCLIKKKSRSATATVPSKWFRWGPSAKVFSHLGG